MTDKRKTVMQQLIIQLTEQKRISDHSIEVCSKSDKWTQREVDHFTTVSQVLDVILINANKLLQAEKEGLIEARDDGRKESHAVEYIGFPPTDNEQWFTGKYGTDE